MSETLLLDLWDFRGFLNGDYLGQAPAAYDPAATCGECDQEWRTRHYLAILRGEALVGSPPPLATRPILGAYRFTRPNPEAMAETLCYGHLQATDTITVSP